jgi:hypothetical protein
VHCCQFYQFATEEYRDIAEIRQHVMFILIGPHVGYFSDENQTVCPTLKK